MWWAKLKINNFRYQEYSNFISFHVSLVCKLLLVMGLLERLWDVRMQQHHGRTQQKIYGCRRASAAMSQELQYWTESQGQMHFVQHVVGIHVYVSLCVHVYMCHMQLCLLLVYLCVKCCLLHARISMCHMYLYVSHVSLCVTCFSMC